MPRLDSLVSIQFAWN